MVPLEEPSQVAVGEDSREPLLAIDEHYRTRAAARDAQRDKHLANREAVGGDAALLAGAHVLFDGG